MPSVVLWVCGGEDALAVLAVEEAVPGGFEEGAGDAVDFARGADAGYIHGGGGDAHDGAWPLALVV